MTPEELRQIANAPGYGTGKVARDRMAAERDIRAILPDPRAMPVMIASGAAMTSMQIPLCHFGYSSEHDADWSIMMDRPCEADAVGHDAALDAEVIAAILNAFRMGIIVVKDPQP